MEKVSSLKTNYKLKNKDNSLGHMSVNNTNFLKKGETNHKNLDNFYFKEFMTEEEKKISME